MWYGITAVILNNKIDFWIRHVEFSLSLSPICQDNLISLFILDKAFFARHCFARNQRMTNLFLFVSASLREGRWEGEEVGTLTSFWWWCAAGTLKPLTAGLGQSASFNFVSFILFCNPVQVSKNLYPIQTLRLTVFRTLSQLHTTDQFPGKWKLINLLCGHQLGSRNFLPIFTVNRTGIKRNRTPESGHFVTQNLY